MCGRFTLTLSPELLAEVYGLDEIPPAFAPRFNIAPTQEVPIVRSAGDKRLLSFARWGLGSKEPAKTINARQETLFDKPAFRAAAQRRRCLVPADGFFEWADDPRGKRVPFHIRFKDGRPFAMAGIFERAGVQSSCSVVTTEANEVIARVHDRMPVILPPEAWPLWLDPTIRDREPLEHLFEPYSAAELVLVPVSTRVNSATFDDPECLALREDEPVETTKPRAEQLGFDFSRRTGSM